MRPDIPRTNDYPADAMQCNICGGHGCDFCADRGWLPAGHKHGRRCERKGCGKPIPPQQYAVYCSLECAERDA